MSWSVIEGDCIKAMRELDEASVDAVVTDPPYGLGFMGKEWDDLPPGLDFAKEALRVLKPGGHLLAFGGSRTYHRLACAVEDAGFEVRDQMMWLYGSGFPKSLDVSKAIDKAAGAEREVCGFYESPEGTTGWKGQNKVGSVDFGASRYEDGERRPITAPATPEAERWDGWGTALKPAHEPIVVARKPLIGTVAENVLSHGTGALNIDGCRIEHDGTGSWGTVNKGDSRSVYGSFGDEDGKTPGSTRNPAGRWPANVILDEEAGRLVDLQSGTTTSGAAGKKASSGFPGGGYDGDYDVPYGDTGGASRFFYCAKASKGERNAGLEGFEEKPAGVKNDSGRGFSKGDPYREIKRANHHPTVKPIELMRYLCRLVTPKGGTVLDPFTGSGTTGCAAVLEGFTFVGIEREPEYAEIARARIDHWNRQPVQMDLLGEAA